MELLNFAKKYPTASGIIVFFILIFLIGLYNNIRRNLEDNKDTEVAQTDSNNSVDEEQAEESGLGTDIEVEEKNEISDKEKIEQTMSYCFSINKYTEEEMIANKDYWYWEPLFEICNQDLTEDNVRDTYISKFSATRGDDIYCHGYEVRLTVTVPGMNLNDLLDDKSGLYEGDGDDSFFGDNRFADQEYYWYHYQDAFEHQNIGDYYTIKDDKLYITFTPVQMDNVGGVVVDYSYYDATLNLKLKSGEKVTRKIKLPFVDPYKCSERN